MHFCIVGTSRSGSTLLRNLLHEHPQLAVFNESHWIPKMYEYFGLGLARSKDLVSIVENTEWDDGQCVFDQNVRLSDADPAEVWQKLHRLRDEVPNITIADFQDCLAEVAFPHKDFRFWADKTPDYGYYMAQIAALWPQCKFIHVVRDPLDTALSMSRHGGVSLQLSAGQHNWVSLSHRQAYKNVEKRKHALPEYYSSCLERMDRIRLESVSLAAGHYREVTYEKLVEDPAGVLSELCGYLGLDSDESWLNQVKSEVRQPRDNSGAAQEVDIHLSERVRLGEVVSTTGMEPNEFKSFCRACPSAEKVIKQLIQNPSLANIYPAMDAGFLASAQNCFSKNSETSPAYSFMEGQVWRRLGLKMKALAPLKASYLAEPNPNRANQLAWTYWDLGMYPKIEPLARYTLSRLPEDKGARRLLLVSLLERKEYAAVEEVLVAWESQGQCDQLYFEMQVKLQLATGKLEQARKGSKIGYVKFRSILFLNVYIQASRSLGNIRSALAGSRLAVSVSQEPYILKRHANLLKECGRWDQALDCYRKIFDSGDQAAPIVRGIVSCLLNVKASHFDAITSEGFKGCRSIVLEASARRAFKEGAPCLSGERAMEWYRLTETVEALNLALQAALLLGREDLIEARLEELKVSGLFDEESGRLEVQYIAKRDVRKALQRHGELVGELGISAGLVHQKAHLLICLSRYKDALAYVEEYQSRFNLTGLLAQLNIFCGNSDTAKKLIDRDGKAISGQRSALGSWYQAHCGDMRESQKLWNQCNPPYTQGKVLLKRESPLAQELDLSVPLVTVIRNELLRLPEFLRYYREIGITCFIFIANNSDDGSVDYLLDQQDVLLYSTTQSYKTFRYGIDWINYLIDLLGLDRWVLYVDVDELLVLPDLEERRLPNLLAELEAEGADCVSAVMLDMHGETLLAGDKYQQGTSFFAQLPYFHNEVDQVPSVAPPYIQHYGGIRRYLFWPEGERGNILTKTPIIRAGKIYFNSSSHTVSPGKVSAMSGAMLHFKFLGESLASVEEEVERLEHAGIIDEYQRYATGIRSLGDTPILNMQSVRYTGSKQLESLGLIRRLPGSRHKQMGAA